MSLMEKLNQKKIICPKPLKNSANKHLSRIQNKPASIVTFLKGKDKTTLNYKNCFDIGKNIAKFHKVGTKIKLYRQNSMSINKLSDLLNVRTFLDHNRPWSQPNEPEAYRISTSQGAFAHAGKRLNNSVVEQNLKEHFEKWAPYIKKFGLLLIELHTINPSITSANLGLTAATAYDATHGFSDQYILELDVFQEVLSEIGMNIDQKHFSKFPNNELATVSINYLKI